MNHGLHVGRRMTASGEVELVGPMDQLDATIEGRRIDGPDAHGHLQRPEEALEVVRRGLGGLSVGVGPIVVGPLEVLRAQGQRLEIAMALDEADMCLLQVKKSGENKGDWDLYRVVQTLPGEAVNRPLSESQCPLVKK